MVHTRTCSLANCDLCHTWSLYLYNSCTGLEPCLEGAQQFPCGKGHYYMRKMKIFTGTLQRAPQQKHRAPRQLLCVSWVISKPATPGLILHGGEKGDWLHAPCWSLPWCPLECSSVLIGLPKRKCLCILCPNLALYKTKLAGLLHAFCRSQKQSSPSYMLHMFLLHGHLLTT